jgi:hypothetical protein
MQILPPVFAQEEIAKSRTAILRAVMVVPGAATGHQGHVTASQHLMQIVRAHPVGHRLHALSVGWPAHARTRQGQGLDIAGLQPQAQGYFSLPVGHQPCRRRWDVELTYQNDITHAPAAQIIPAPEM